MKQYTNEFLKNKIEKKNRIKRILKYIFSPILILIVICATNIVYQAVIKKDVDINIFGFKPYIVLSGSMEPNLQIGDMIISKSVNEDQIKIGDIITFVDNNKNIITHRVVDILIKDGKKLYQTKGDNNSSKDVGVISIENIKGKYSFKISKIGSIITEMITPTGLIITILIITIFYISTSKTNDRKIARHQIRKRYENKNN